MRYNVSNLNNKKSKQSKLESSYLSYPIYFNVTSNKTVLSAQANMIRPICLNHNTLEKIIIFTFFNIKKS